LGSVREAEIFATLLFYPMFSGSPNGSSRSPRKGGLIAVHSSGVIPYAPFDYVSYSCYESLSHPDPAKALVADLNKIRDVTGSSRLIVGEVGFSRAMSGAKVTALLQSVVSAAIGWGAEYIIHWNLHDQSPTEDFGLYDLNGRITEIGVFYNGVFKRERACSGTANYFLSPSCAVVLAR